MQIGSSPRRRRQYKSCDQCREGKRRCDVKISSNISSEKSTVSPCSNCTKWKKSCSIEWIITRHRTPSGPIQQQTAIVPHLLETGFIPMEYMVDAWTSQEVGSPLLGYNLDSNASTMQPEAPYAEQPSSSASGPSESSWGDVSLADQGLALDSLGLHFTSTANGQTGIAEVDCSSARTLQEQLLSNGIYRPDGFRSNGDIPNSADVLHSPTVSPRSKRFRQALNAMMAPGRVSSPFTSQLLAEDQEKLFIKEGLLKIYHDSLEGALSCWLTERNCPYTYKVFDGKDVWSSKWTNRIVTRVCELDKVYSEAGVLSKADQLQASSVLNLVVMAFAAQWSQTGERSHSRLTTTTSVLHSLPGARSEADFEQLDDDVFGRTMQKSLWHRAHQALSEASGNSSFRVIFAGVIFALTQRPIDRDEVLQNVNNQQQDGLESLQKILDLDGPPIFLDIALRKLHDHQRRLDDAKTPGAVNSLMPGVPQELSQGHKESFFLLYWLAVMFDTLSAAVNRRAFTVCDADSSCVSSTSSSLAASAQQSDLLVDLDGWSGFSNSTSSREYLSSRPSNIWGDFFLHHQSQAGQSRKQNIRWPCSYVDSAACLADAAPVKVLLFRRVAHLQDFLYRRPSPEEVEKAIDAVIEVYDHWINSYGLFIDDCTRHHEDLPARIQSWYILLAGHWNLAVMILADVIDAFDDAYRTMLFSRCKRQSIQFTKTLRIRSAVAVSDLGRCSRYGEEDLSFSKAPDFHHAVNKAALLTEPWTMVLVRSFGLAGGILARTLAGSMHTVATAESTEMRIRLQYCIDALWLLGKKSDMALCAAQVLHKAVADRER